MNSVMRDWKSKMWMHPICNFWFSWHQPTRSFYKKKICCVNTSLVKTFLPLSDTDYCKSFKYKYKGCIKPSIILKLSLFCKRFQDALVNFSVVRRLQMVRIEMTSLVPDLASRPNRPQSVSYLLKTVNHAVKHRLRNEHWTESARDLRYTRPMHDV